MGFGRSESWGLLRVVSVIVIIFSSSVQESASSRKFLTGLIIGTLLGE